MAATGQDGGEQGLESMSVPRGECLEEQGMDTGAGVGNGAGLHNGPLDSPQDDSSHQQNLDESTAQQDAQYVSGDLFDLPQDASSGHNLKRAVRSRKNPTPRKVSTPLKSPTPIYSPGKTTEQKKRRGRRPKGETLPSIENSLTSTPAPTPENPEEVLEEQGMTPAPQKKRRGRKPKGETLPPIGDLLISSPALAPRNQQEAADEQEMTPTPQKKRGRKPKGYIVPPIEYPLTSTPTGTPQNQREFQEEPELTNSGRPKRRAARVAMEYLHSLVEDQDGLPQTLERKEAWPGPVSTSVPPTEPARTKGKRGRKRKARVREGSDASGDEDFVPDVRGETEEEEEEEDEPCYDDSIVSFAKARRKSLQVTPRDKTPHHSNKPKFPGIAANGLMNNIMGPIWCCATVTKQFREEHCAPWVFPEWIPSAKDWRFLSESEADNYLPKEKQSPAFRISREGLNEDSKPCRIKRFEALPFHAERWDMCFFVGGPVWSMEWCPCPDGGAGSQFAAIYCNKGMDDRHKMTGTHSEPSLLQVWDMGELQYDTCPASPPQLAYAIALDDGCIWDMKWCPSSAWELPTTCRKVPHMPRLGLLAAALSSGKIAVYSLPHRLALTDLRKSQAKGGSSQAPLICKVQTVAVLKVGSVQAGDAAHTGQCFCVDWLPVKPHNTVAAGFFNGSVSLWNLPTRSQLLRVRAPGGSVWLYPYHSFIAHDNAIQTLAWCRASSDLLATAGDDRKIKFWDLRKTYEPVSIHRRYLSTEICWPLIWPGIFAAQQCCYVTYGQHGIHYLDAGYFGYKPFFIAPRKGTIWSASFSDWMNTCVTGDSTGEMIMILLPDLSSNPNTIKRTADRRFPVFRGEMVQFPGSESGDSNGQESQIYSEVIKKYYLQFHDTDMRTFKNAAQRASVKHMHATETKGDLSLDQMPLNSVHKVRLNPNLCCQSWVLSAGQSGLVRAHCLRAMNSAVVDKMVRESEAQFAAMFDSSQGPSGNPSGTTTVHHSTDCTVQVV